MRPARRLRISQNFSAWTRVLPFPTSSSRAPCFLSVVQSYFSCPALAPYRVDFPVSLTRDTLPTLLKLPTISKRLHRPPSSFFPPFKVPPRLCATPPLLKRFPICGMRRTSPSMPQIFTTSSPPHTCPRKTQFPSHFFLMNPGTDWSLTIPRAPSPFHPLRFIPYNPKPSFRVRIFLTFCSNHDLVMPVEHSS